MRGGGVLFLHGGKNMSFDVHSVAGQGSIRQANQTTQSQPQAQRERSSRSTQNDSMNAEALKNRIQVETARQQQVDAAQRAQEREAVQAASREDVEREVQQALKELKEINLSFNHKLKYTLNYDEHEIIVKVIDPDTDEVIKELPPLAMQKLHSRIQDFIGLLVDEEA
jgi:flagellar protein FlaG